MEHQISLTREELQHEWDLSSRLCERLTEAVRTLAAERDEARKQRDKLREFCREQIPYMIIDLQKRTDGIRDVCTVPDVLQRLRAMLLLACADLSSVEK